VFLFGNNKKCCSLNSADPIYTGCLVGAKPSLNRYMSIGNGCIELAGFLGTRLRGCDAVMDHREIGSLALCA